MSILNKVIFLLQRVYYNKKGFSNYYVSFWRKEMKESYKNSPIPKKKKKWAYKRGFLPHRLIHYSLTEENYKKIVSDRDYFYLYPLNNNYKMWIDDKLTMKYILRPFDRFLPKYYFHIMKERDVMRLMDCPKELDATVEGIINLLDDKGVLAAKTSAGTYGIGFYKLESKNHHYYVNGNEYTKENFKEFLKSLDDYIITEFVEMHKDIKKLNPSSVNTIRVTVINEHGNDPIIPFAFMRVGSKASGVVDNVAQGGMVCKVDVETGRFYNGEGLKNNLYFAVETHPDTGEKMEGFIPHWELVKTELKKMCEYYPQLKWLGYDVAITEDGFCILEINSHQGLHKAHEYPAEVTDFLMREIEKKKKKYNQK